MRRTVQTFVGVVGVTALACLLALRLATPNLASSVLLRDWLAFTALLLLAVLLQALSASILTSSGGRAFSSVAAIPYLAMLPLFGPFISVVGSAVAETTASLLIRRLPKIKAAFNVSQLVIALTAAGFVYIWLGGPITAPEISLTYQTVAAFVLAAAVFFGINSILISAVVALDSGESFRRTWNLVTAGIWSGDLAAGTLALALTFLYAEIQLIGLVALLLPLLFLHHTNRLNVKLHQLNRDLLRLIVRTIEAKDPYTSGHSVRVSRLCRRIAEELKLAPKTVEMVETAALLHDFGKIDIAYGEIISQRGPLSPQQRSVIRSHPVRGAELLGSISTLDRQITEAVRHHHEHFDGTGYPDGLSGEDIPLAARIIMVADTVDAMLSVRPYRPALPVTTVQQELARLQGKQFDPRITDIFLRANVLAEYGAQKDTEQPSHMLPLRRAERPSGTLQKPLNRVTS